MKFVETNFIGYKIRFSVFYNSFRNIFRAEMHAYRQADGRSEFSKRPERLRMRLKLTLTASILQQ